MFHLEIEELFAIEKYLQIKELFANQIIICRTVSLQIEELSVDRLIICRLKIYLEIEELWIEL